MTSEQKKAIRATAAALGINEDEVKRMLEAKPADGKPDRFVTRNEAAALMAICPHTVDAMAAAGKLKKVILTPSWKTKTGKRLGGSVRFRLSDVQSIIQNGISA